MQFLNARIPIYLLLWLIVIIFAIWSHLYFGDYEAINALGGWSAHDFTNTILYPENFKRDYPGGSWTSGNSSLPWIYPGLAAIGIPVDITIPILIGFEIIILTTGAFFLLQTLFKNLHIIALLVLTSVFALSYIRFGDLARFANPYFHGHFYGYADGLRLFAIAYYLRGRHKLSSTVLVIGFTIHPIKTLSGFIFICGMQLWKWRTILKSKIISPYLLFTLFASLWAYCWLGLGRDLDFPQMTAAEFFKYSPLFNYHWYPQDLNIFTKYHLVYPTAFLSAVLVGISTIVRCDFQADLKMQLFFGTLLVCMMAIVGLTVSWFELSPTLVKMSLQRSTVLILSVMSILVLGKLLIDIKNAQWWYAFLLAFLIISSFYTKETWLVLISLTYAISTLLSVNQKDTATRTLKTSIIILGIFIICYEYYLYTLNFQHKHYWIIQTQLLGALILGAAGYNTLSSVWRNRFDTYMTKYSPIIVTILFTASAVSWSMDNKRLSKKYVDQGQAYKDVQLWAKNNTDIDDLFMTDPTIQYGWRDYSQRSSFGTLQEWYKTGWLYTNNQNELHNGLERAERLGVNQLVPERSEKMPQSEFMKISYRRALNTFYQPDGKVLAGIARDYDIQYIVMDKDKAEKNGAIPPWPIAYENAYYTVLTAPHLNPAI